MAFLLSFAAPLQPPASAATAGYHVPGLHHTDELHLTASQLHNAESGLQGNYAGPLPRSSAAIGCCVVVTAIGARRAAGRRSVRVFRSATVEKPSSSAPASDEGAPSDKLPIATIVNTPSVNFASGDKIASARAMAKGRAFIVAPWGEDVKTKPFMVASDCSGSVASLLTKAAFAQFGSTEKLRTSVKAHLQSEEEVHELLAKAATFKGQPAMVVYTLADKKLDKLMKDEAIKLNVPVVNVLEGLLAAMERRFDMKRSTSINTDDYSKALDDYNDCGVYCMSDSAGGCATAATRAALKQFRGACVEKLTVCPNVRTLEEIQMVVFEAFSNESIVTFSFANPGMGRFTRMQCERLKVDYADIYQPLVIAMERYLDYPLVGVPGGMDLKELEISKKSWRIEQV